MTNEKAIEYNKNLREYMRITDTESEFKFLKENYEALDMAIKVLEQIPDLKETYNKGYKDGQKTLAFHLELCKEEGSVITVPEGATNGDMIKAVFPNCEVTPHVRTDTLSTAVSTYGIDVKVFHTDGSYFKLWFTDEWWNSPYGKSRNEK